ncbi:hypothetical protein CgunFtcFv8_010165 [Champsocephalus gunnari]|uniref:Uncharacterized protein n=1 Tax=Champsocephalus gunnari TaxID=52237 RepID=A0AAN8HZ76_CHAGU|nr:hypothetical protein CgunFtcFv8_010165 [Champsocephalus gunnari]
MMSSEPQPSSTAENRRFSITAVTAIHQRRENAVAREGAMMEMGREGQGGGRLQPERQEAGRRDETRIRPLCI